MTSECWCAYGGEGLESVHPQCPIHGTEPAPVMDERELEPCDICRDGWEECYCDDDADCYHCGGSGERIPDHCCACGGSPYCNCCTRCGASCVGACTCPIPVQISDGTTRTV